MIRNGLYHITVETVDGIEAAIQGVMVVRDGTRRGGELVCSCQGTYDLQQVEAPAADFRSERGIARGQAGLGVVACRQRQ